MENPNSPAPQEREPGQSNPPPPIPPQPAPEPPASVEMPSQPRLPNPEPSATPPPASGGITEQQWILFLNVSALAGLVIPSMGHILGPLIIWLIKKPESAAIDAAGRAVLNFQISWTIWMILSVVVAFVGSCLVVPIVLPFAVGIAWLVFVIIGSLKASNGEPYTFPMTLKML